MNSYTIDLGKISEEKFATICQKNPDGKFELNGKGELIIMSPTGWETGKRNAELVGQLWLWNRQTQLGEVFDSSTGFKLSNGAIRSPDVAWITKEKWVSITPEARAKFPSLAPDFVLELMSPRDTLKATQAKLEEYVGTGVRLGWLINPKTRQVYIYRPGKTWEILDSPSTLSGEDVLPGFVLELSFKTFSIIM
ncbi:MAG: Uma2 family endonuclease [Gomphosphaeria aponina SAG 52.96 = DSM 107014]|uniref:Uma2 family endonuclease n=1 Tax=Gomphosphaeria aponina SAG 52.96 = DSM 107014 TaxID=1521640 RepID=A0A941GT94_9CHRO|nr:Uma2 family endonuclease [Gomphosphaeria aponina SAG 52.96 = DSM 107014]